MKVPTAEHIQQAQQRLTGIIRNTPLRWSETLSNMAGFSVHVKMENQQKTGSFKLRGAANRILGGQTSASGVVAASAGNHAQGVAYAAQQAGIGATIVMPKGAPLVKAEATKNYGAQVVQQGANYDECYEIALELATQKELTYIHAFDDPLIVAGQGTICLEVLRQHPGIRQLVVPIGGGGLISGIALAAKQIDPRLRVIGVQAEGADAVYRDFKGMDAQPSQAVTTIADGIAVKQPGSLTSHLISKYVDDVITVNDEEIASAMLISLERLKTTVEGAGAASLAAVLFKDGSFHPVPTAVVLSGGNVDVNFISQLIQRGLLKTGRVALMKVDIPDRPGNLQRILNSVSGLGANIISIVHERLDLEIPLGWTQVTLSLETRNREHIEDMVAELQEQGLRIQIL